MKHKLNVNGDIESAGGLRSAGTFPSVKPYSKPFNRNIMKQKKIMRQPQKKPSPRQQKSRKREDGRPQGTLKRFPFDETRIGFMLRYEMPVVYHLLRRLCATQQLRAGLQVIRSVAEASKDPSCGKAKFRRYLDEYRRNGVYCRRGKRLTPERKAYYEAYAAAREKSISAGTAGGCLPKRGTRRAATDCSGRLKTFLK